MAINGKWKWHHSVYHIRLPVTLPLRCKCSSILCHFRDIWRWDLGQSLLNLRTCARFVHRWTLRAQNFLFAVDSMCHSPPGHSPQTYSPGQFPSLFTWCRTFPLPPPPNADLYKAIYRNWKLALTRIPDLKGPTTWGPDHNSNPNRPTGQEIIWKLAWRNTPTRITWSHSVRWCLAVGLASGDQRRLTRSGSALEALRDNALYKSTYFTFFINSHSWP